MLRFLRIERPTTQTLRPTSTATSIACCMRWTFEAKEEIEDAPAALRDDLAERLADDALGRRHAGPLGVRRVAEQEVDAAVADLGEPADVGPQAVDRRVVDLVVAGDDDPAAGRLEHDRDRVGDRVRHAHELEPERAELDRRALRVDLAQLGAAQQAVLVELRLDQPEREPRRPDLGRAHLAQQVRQRADVVLVPVREHDARGSRRAARAGSAKSGSTRSTPRCSSRGNARPASTTTIVPSASNAVMFLPTSPRPPSGMIAGGSPFMHGGV